MALIIPPGFGLGTWQFRWSGSARPWVVTCGLDLTGAAGDFAGVALEQSASITQAGGFLAYLDSQCVYEHYTLRVGADPGPGPTFVVPRGEVGERVGSSPPVAITALVRKNTAQGGRRGRGRMYFTGVFDEDDIDELGTFNSGTMTSLQDAATSMFISLRDGLGGSPTPTPAVILHDSEGLGAEPAPTECTSFVVQALAGTQRRRMRR